MKRRASRGLGARYLGLPLRAERSSRERPAAVTTGTRTEGLNELQEEGAPHCGHVERSTENFEPQYRHVVIFGSGSWISSGWWLWRYSRTSALVLGNCSRTLMINSYLLESSSSSG